MTEALQDLEVVGASKSSHGFLVSPLSEHINEMDDGSLVILGCPVARTGWQEYTIRDLPKNAASLGVDVSNPSATIDLYRPEEEVFNPEFLASLNGRPITDGHPPGFVTPENFNRYSMGHIQNVRRGPQLDSGEWPIIADLVISAEPLIGKIKRKEARDNSLGYDFAIERDGDRIIQCGMLANHNAVVPKGRAGDLIAIGDAAALDAQVLVEASKPSAEDSPTKPDTAPPEPAASPPEPSAGHAVASTLNAPQPKKEKPKVKNKVLDLIGRGFKALAMDAETSPEELAQAAVDVGKYHDEAAEPEMTPEQQTIADKKARDAARRGRDNNDPEFGPNIEETETQDARRRKAHDDLDAMLDGRGRVKDADIAMLKDLLDEYLGEEEEEPEHMEDADPAELEEVLGAGENPDAEDEEEVPCPECGDEACPGCGAATDLEAEPGEELEPSGEVALARDASGSRRATPRVRVGDARDATKAVLKMFRPFVARSNDEALKRTYNTALDSLNRTSVARPAGGGYGAFVGAAASRSRSVGSPPLVARARATDAASKDAKLQEYYNECLKGGK